MEIERLLIEDASSEDLLRGYREEEHGYTCLLCGQHFHKGEIYSIQDKLFDAQKAVLIHIEEIHESVLAYLLKMSPTTMGLSQLQLELLNLFASGLSDKEIASYLGVAGSTIRNHRYKLREREKQARVFLTIMTLLEVKQGVKNKSEQPSMEQVAYVYTINQNTTISEKDKKKIIETYITPAGKLTHYPDTDQAKKVILEHILDRFSKGEKYGDAEVNAILMNIYTDYTLLKRDLLEFDFLNRTEKGSIYWVKGA